jgi:hypothetical protein
MAAKIGQANGNMVTRMEPLRGTGADLGLLNRYFEGAPDARHAARSWKRISEARVWVVEGGGGGCL